MNNVDFSPSFIIIVLNGGLADSAGASNRPESKLECLMPSVAGQPARRSSPSRNFFPLFSFFRHSHLSLPSFFSPFGASPLLSAG
jgi:hypothetical protein